MKKNKIGDFIRLKRLQKRITQTQLAQKASMRQCEISFLEGRKALIPAPKKLVIIASEIEVHPDLLCLMAGRTPTKLQEWIFVDPEKHGQVCLNFLEKI